jgi:folylpolyglutamate synthase/dihydropteroate synthase
MLKAGAALRRLIGKERLVAVFAMLAERDPAVVLTALRTVAPDAVVFTEPASAHGHAVAAERLVEVWGPGSETAIPAESALARARELAGSDGTVFVCGSLYLVGEVLAVTAAS